MTTANIDLGRETLISLIAKFTNAIIGFVGIVLFANILGSAKIGDYYFLLTISQLLVQFTGGLGGAIRKRVSEVGVSPERFFGLGLTSHAIYLALIVPVIVLLKPYLPLGGTSQFDPLFTLIVIGLLTGVIGLFALTNRMYAGLGNPSKSMWFDALRSVFTLTSQIALLQMGYGAFGLLLGLAIGSFITVVLVTWVANVVPELPDKETLKSTYQYAKWSIPSSVVSNLYSRLDVLFIGAFVGSVAVGYYETAYRLSLPAILFASSISGPLSVKSSGKTSIKESITEDVRNAITYSAFLSIPLFFGALVIAEPVLATIYGPEFAGGAELLIGITAFLVFRSLKTPIATAINGSDNPQITFRIQAVGILLNLPVAYLLVMKYDAIGVVVATLLMEVLMLGWLQYHSQYFGGPFLPKPIVPQLIAGFVMYAVVSKVVTYLPITDWLSMLVIVGIGATVYTGVVAVLSQHFRDTSYLILKPLFKDMVSGIRTL